MNAEPPIRHGVFARRALIAGGTTLLLTTVALLVWFSVEVLLLIFAGLLLAIFLRSLADWVKEHTPLSAGWALAAVTLALAALLVGGVGLLAPSVAVQIDELSENLPDSVKRLEDRLDDSRWGQWLLSQAKEADQFLPERQRMLRQATGIFSTTLGTVTGLAIILAVGLYLAAEPGTYRKGVVQLVPAARRSRAREVLAEVGSTLRWWLWGKLLGMLGIGVLTTLGLWLLGVPLALALGLLAALLTFIPNIGPILAVVPAALLALLDSPTKALSVLGLYLAIQTVESYLITPLVQRRTISMPPALTITAQLVLGVLLGAMGVVLATPLTAAAMVLVKMLYIDDALVSTDDKC
jgi:predicted PurR-regulated permease PerM